MRALLLMCVLASASAAQESRFERVPPGSLPTGVEGVRWGTAPIKEERGSVLFFEEGQVVRMEGGRRKPLDCTLEGGPGTVLGLFRDPAGLTFVAAERGIFLASHNSDVLDLVKRREGVPLGAPVSVYVAPDRRVWVGTAEEFGVMDASFFYGRTITGDGPPKGPFHVSGDADGHVILHTPSGIWRYRADAGARPGVDSVQVAGTSVASGDSLSVAFGEPLALTCSGSGVGGVTFRYRLDGHHVLRPVEEDTALEGLSPGRRRVEVIAFDEGLGRSDVFEFFIEVPYPIYYENWFVLVVGLGAALVTFAFFGSRARRTGAALFSAKPILSTVLLLVFGLQLLAGVIPHAKGWPFVGYGMYSKFYAEGDIVFEGGLVGLMENGHSRRINAQAAGVATDSRWSILRPMINSGDVASAAWLHEYNTYHPDVPLTGIQVHAHRTRLMAGGPVRIAPLILSDYRLGGASDDE